jgi:hypothetical protein
MSFGSEIAADPREYSRWMKADRALQRAGGASGFPAVPGVAPRFTFDTGPFEATMSRMPETIARGIYRKALRAGLKVWQGIAEVQYGARHRSRFNRPHVADHFFNWTSIRRNAGGFSIYGAVAVKKSGTILREGKGDGKWKAYFNDLPGWRFHFVEGGTYGRRGAQILPAVLAQYRLLMESMVRQTIDKELRRAGFA